MMLPDNTYYFYGYPWAAEKDSTERYPFYNRAPFWTVERKVVQRPLSMSLPILNFASNNTKFAQYVYDLMSIVPKQIYFPKEVEQTNSLLEKDRRIKAYIYKLFVEEGVRIQQAQPYTDPMLWDVYAEACRDSYLLNDKSRMQDWIPEQFLLQRGYCPFEQFPFVAKLARSSAGDATRIIYSPSDLKAFIQEFGWYNIPIVYEEFCDWEEQGMEFYRWWNGTLELLCGVSSQIDANNSYVWWVIAKDVLIDKSTFELIKALEQWLQGKKWFGWWWVDVRRWIDGNWKVIDPNMRITQVMPAAVDINHIWCQSLMYCTAKIQQTWSLLKIKTMIKDDGIRLYAFCEYEWVVYLDIGIEHNDVSIVEEKRAMLRTKYWMIL